MMKFKKNEGRSIKSFTFAVLIVFSVFTLNASAKSDIYVTKKKSNKVLVCAANIENDLIKLKLEDLSNNSIIFRKTYKQNEIAATLDISKIESGDYRLIAESGKDSYEFDLQKRESDILIRKRVKFSTPKFFMKKKNLIVSYNNFNSDDTNIIIYDSNDRVLYEGVKDTKMAFSRNFNLSKLESGRYRVVFKSGKNEINKDIYVADDIAGMYK